MKRNEFATFLVYVVMIIVAVLFGIFWIRPTITEVSSALPIPGIVLVIISLVVGVIFNSALLEIGHYLGAKVGHYEIKSFVILGLGKKAKEGTDKAKFGFHKFSGLTGETKVVPADVEKSRLGGYITLPILFFLIEAVGCAVMIAIGNANKATGLGALSIIGITLLGVAAMIVIYDYAPTRLDEVTDGYLMMVTSKNINKIAYNHILVCEEAVREGKPVPKTPIYEEITDFTFHLNLSIYYEAIKNKDYKTAFRILDLALDTDKGFSKSNFYKAKAMKLALILEDPRNPQGTKMYEELDDGTKSFISALEVPAAVKCYILISSFIEQSEGECNYAIEKAEKALKNEDPQFAPYEKEALERIGNFVRANHPGWTVEDLPWIAKEKMAKEAEKEDEEEEE
ncbi:MAG: hypothetical protein II467_00330 [Bacilli bacterium]|nr:hypothetical protein [Bacilli bacterium]